MICSLNFERQCGCLSTPGSLIDRCEAWGLEPDNRFDGDQMSSYCVMTEEGKADVKRLLNSKDHFLTLDGSMAFSLNTDTNSLALQYLTSY